MNTYLVIQIKQSNCNYAYVETVSSNINILSMAKDNVITITAFRTLRAANENAMMINKLRELKK